MTGWRRLLPWVWTGLIGFVWLVLGITEFRSGNQGEAALGLFVLIPLMTITALGSIVGLRQPGNRIAWLLHLVSLVLLLSIWSYRIVQEGQSETPQFADYFAVVVQNAVAPAMLYAVFLFLYLFPTGHFMTPRWRWVWWVGVSYFSVLLFVATFTVETGPDFVDNIRQPWSMPNPIGFIPVGIQFALVDVMPFLLLAVALGGVSSIVIRYRRSDLIIRTQIKWVLLAAVVSLIALPIGISDLEVVSALFMMITITAIPTAVAIAITRYKLFEIDRLISRSISYAIVAILLGAVFVTGAVWLPTQLFEDQPPLLVAATTLAVAALFNPFRNRVQKAVDKKFNRSSYEAENVADEFGAQLQESLTVGQLADTWVRTVDTYLKPSASGIWLSPQRAKTSLHDRQPRAARPEQERR